MFLRLRARLILIVVLAGAPAAGFLVYDAVDHRAREIHGAGEHAAFIAGLATLEHRQLVSATRQILAALSALPAVKGSDSIQCDAALRSVLAQGGAYANFGVVSTDGNIWCSAVPLGEPVNVSDRAYFRRVLATGEYSVGDFQIGRVTGLPVIVFAHPVRAGNGELAGVIFAGVIVEWLHRQIAATPLPPRSTVNIIGPDGTVLLRHPADPASIGKPATVAPYLDRAAKAPFLELAGADRVRRVYAVRPLGDRPEANTPFISIGIPVDEIHRRADETLLWFVGVIALVSAAILLLAWRLGDALVGRSLYALQAAADKLGAGDVSARVSLEHPYHEVEQLANGFNRMAAAIQEQVARVHRLNRIYAVLSGINGAILRIRNAEELLQVVCRIAVEKGGFRIARIALPLRAGGWDVLAEAGASAEAIPSPDPLTVDPDSPLGRAVAAGREVVLDDLGDPATPPAWREYLTDRGCRALVALPIRSGEDPPAYFLLCADQAGVFDASELTLLREVTADTGLGLEYIEKDSRLEFLARHDALTGLPNRAMLDDRLAQAIARAGHSRRHVAVVALEVADFNRITDTLGHNAGDAVLQALANYLPGRLREGDTVASLARGTLAVALVDVASVDDIADVMQRIVSDMPASIAVTGQEVFISVRCGVAVYPQDGQTSEALIPSAELAAHSTVPDSPTTFAFHSPDMNAKAHRRLAYERGLRHAIDRQELSLHYQPVVDLTSKRIIGAEALLRWNSGEFGNTPPSVFIPIAEETRLIVPIGAWVLRETCEQSLRWHAAGLGGLDCAVNVAMQQLSIPGFAQQVGALLESVGFDPSRTPLSLEVTESQLMANRLAVIAVLKDLKGLHLRIAIDDFGTGYSSLSYLRDLPVDVVKIDRSFIKDVCDPEGKAIVASIIQLAHGLQLKVIAEGVETKQQLAALETLGCDAAQGYWLARPMPAAEFEALAALGAGHGPWAP